MGAAFGIAARDCGAVLFEAETAATRGAQHVSVAQVDRGFARQQFVAADSAEFAAVFAVATIDAVDFCTAAARLAKQRADRRPIYLSARQFGEHERDRRGPDAFGRGEEADAVVDRRHA